MILVLRHHYKTQGLISICLIIKGLDLCSFDDLCQKHGLDKNDFYRYLQLCEYFSKTWKVSVQWKFLMLSRYS